MQYASITTYSRPTQKRGLSRIAGGDSPEESIAESDYKYIPNNFKLKDGVAFPVTITKINFDAGLSGIYNMGNTCFFSTGKKHKYNTCSCIMSQCCSTLKWFFHRRSTFSIYK